MFAVISIKRGKKLLYVANHPVSKRDKVKLHPSRKRAHVFPSWHTAQNIRDGLLRQGATLQRA